MDRRIAHLDMDAFYASVELLRYPQLKGLPLVIGGRRRRTSDEERDAASFPRLREYVGRGVATTATYEARAFGVHSAMGLMKAAALAPEAILLPADFEQYTRFSRMFKAAVRDIAPQVEDRGIDEIYIDLTDLAGESVALAQRIKDAVREATGLSCSIGVTPNKLLSKIASELQKPNGLTVLTHADLPARIWPLSVRKINGIGPRATARLEDLNIRTIGELAATPEQMLIDRFGKHYGHWLNEAAHGRDERPVVTHSEPKSLSRETTFERDMDSRRDRQFLSEILLELCTRLADDLDRRGYVARTIGLKLRFDDFRTLTRDTSLTVPTAQAETIREAVRQSLRRVTFERRLRLLGVKAASLLRADDARLPEEKHRQYAAQQQAGYTLPLFDERSG